MFFFRHGQHGQEPMRSGVSIMTFFGHTTSVAALQLYSFEFLEFRIQPMPYYLSISGNYKKHLNFGSGTIIPDPGKSFGSATLHITGTVH